MPGNDIGTFGTASPWEMYEEPVSGASRLTAAGEAAKAAAMAAYQNRGAAPAGWNWSQEMAPWQEASETGNPVGASYADYAGPGDLSRFAGSGGGNWFTNRGDNMELGRLGPDGTVIDQQLASGGGWNFQDLAAMAATAYGASALAGAEGTAMGDGAFLGEGAASGVPAWDAALAGAPAVSSGLAGKAIDFLTNPKNFTQLMQGGSQAAGNSPFSGVPGDNGRAMAEALRKKSSMQQQDFNPTWMQP